LSSRKKQDVWAPFRFFVGSWQGTGEGGSGRSRTERTYNFVLNEKFLQVKNKSVFAPNEKNPKGETHEDIGYFSYDTTRKSFVFRQFHVEGFVNQYILDSLDDEPKTIVFVTESIENIPPGWRAKETYKVLSDEGFTEIFELAAPGKEFKACAKNHLKKV